MSNPINPLSKYRSYAYQQVLIVCDTTETAEALSKTDSYLAFLRAQNAERQNTPDHPYGKYKPYNISLDKGRTGQYIILISGSQDAEFVITKAHWYNTVAAGAGGVGNQYSTYNIGGELEISEPQGIRFMNVLAHAADELKSDPSGLIFMLKTVFVGHSSPDYVSAGFPDPITNVRPILFWASDISGTFTITGGDYKMEFAGINHGASKGQHILHGADRIKFDTANTVAETGCQANTLAGALCRLQNRVGVIYDSYYNKVKQEIENTVDENGKKLQFKGRKVNYIIQAEDPYDKAEYIVTDFKDAATNTAESNKGGMIDLSSEPSVEAAILAIAKRCPKIQEDLTKGDGQTTKKVRYVPKVATTIQSSDTEYNIIYKLRRVVESREDMLELVSNRTSDNVDDLQKSITENLLTLDYMYTGRNTDIIDFDLKMELGLVLFQNMVTTENVPDVADSVDGSSVSQKTATAKPATVAATPSGRVRPGTPLFLSTKVQKETLKHVTNPKRTIDFQELLNRHAAIENIEAVVKIHGNPGLLNTVNQPPSEIVAGVTYKDTGAITAGNTKDDETSTHDVFPYWERLPAIVKINIRMPSTYYGGTRDTHDYTEPFWYQGYYYCYAIEQMFDGGEFTQQLHMVSLPKNSPEDNKQTDISKTDQDTQTAKENQTTKTAGAGTSAGTGTTVPSNNQQPLTITITKDASAYTSKQYQEEHSGNK